MKSASLCGSRFSSDGTRWSSAPLHRVPKTSKVDTSKRSGEWFEMRSSLVMPKYFRAHETKRATDSWVIITPFGMPVEPEVNNRCARSSPRLGNAIGAEEYVVRSRIRNAIGGD